MANQPYLLDHSVLLELERIPKEEQKTEHANFNRKNISLNFRFSTISAAISLYDEVEMDEVGCM
ncbi:hypothetical protein AABM34_20285 [Lysinibacillus fusiformis]